MPKRQRPAGVCAAIPPLLRIAILAGALAAVCTAACTTQILAPNDDGRSILEGTWGGDHIVLQLTKEGGTVEYDCARGTIDAAVRPDGQGRFTAAGSHVFGTGGPERVDAPKQQEPARYSGVVRDSTMTLTVLLTNSGQSIGTYELTRGSAGVLRKCL